MPVNVGRGKQYATVQERLSAAHGEKAQPVGIQGILTEPVSLPAPVGAVVVIRATVTFEDGRQFTGISEAQFDATSGADKTNPVEVAETSAVGRALAMAGYYGSEDGIAGAEEVRQAQRRQTQERTYGSGRAADPAQELRDAGAVARESPPHRPTKDAPPREWFAYLAPAARRLGINVPTIARDMLDDEIDDLNRSLGAAIREAQGKGA